MDDFSPFCLARLVWSNEYFRIGRLLGHLWSGFSNLLMKITKIKIKVPTASFVQIDFVRYYCVASDVTAAMLVVKNKSISLLWELNSIFMKILREKILLYWPPTWLPFSRGCIPRIEKQLHVEYASWKKNNNNNNWE